MWEKIFFWGGRYDPRAPFPYIRALVGGNIEGLQRTSIFETYKHKHMDNYSRIITMKMCII